jgi:hypothetical protein
MDEDEFQKRKERLLDREAEFERDLYRGLLTLSAGILGLSLTVFRFVTPSPVLAQGWLYTSWGCLALAAVLVIVYLHLAQWAARKKIELLTENRNRIRDPNPIETFKKAEEYIQSGTFKKWWIRKKDELPQRASLATGVSATISFVIGIFCLSVFTYQNISHSELSENENKLEQRVDQLHQRLDSLSKESN